MSKKFPIYLAKIETSSDGSRYFRRDDNPYSKFEDKIYTSKLFFKFRKVYIDKPNCNFDCPVGKEFYCCKNSNCVNHYGFFIWEEMFLFSKEEKEKILSMWDNITGFYRQYDCILPRKLRSFICLSWVCPYCRNKD